MGRAMAINIKGREATRLLGEIASTTGKEASRIILDLLRQEAMRVRRQHDKEQIRRKVLEIATRHRKRLKGRIRPHEEVIGYDENGLPI
jgi:hypothetical protein